MIEVEYCKPLREIREHELFFVLDGEHEMNYYVQEVDNYVIEYSQLHTETSTHANKLTNEQRMEIDTFIHDYNYE